MFKIIFSVLFLALLTSSCFFNKESIKSEEIISKTWSVEQNNSWKVIDQKNLSGEVLENNSSKKLLENNSNNTGVLSEEKKTETWVNINKNGKDIKWKKADTNEKIVDDFTKEIDSVSELINEDGK